MHVENSRQLRRWRTGGELKSKWTDEEEWGKKRQREKRKMESVCDTRATLDPLSQVASKYI